MNPPVNHAHILIVDDTPRDIEALKTVLDDLGQHLIFATSADEALRQVLQYDFAVILLDVHMPIMNGFEVAKLIRSRKKSSYTPIIFLSAISKDDENINEGYAMGAVDYVFKPINPIILRSKVKVFVDLFTKSSIAVNLQNELTRRQQAEARALRQQKQLALTEMNRLITMEEITSAISHELNQPLTVINTYINGCIHRINNGAFKLEEITEALSYASMHAERAGAILHRIKGYMRKNDTYLESVEINHLIENIKPLLQDKVKESGIKLKIQLSKNKLPKLLLDKIQFEQVISNIIINGMEALQSFSTPDRLITLETKCQAKNNILINIKDNGPGINKDDINKVFDLYFTTKAKGMGIGLSICRSIVEAHGGNIMVFNNADGGACFQIILPTLTKPNKPDTKPEK